MSAEEEIREAVDEAKEPGTFNIVKVLQERGYPQTTVKIVLDEELIYEAATLKQEIESIDSSIGKSNPSARQKELLETLTEKHEELAAKIRDSFYTVHIRGISEGKREELYNLAKKKFPIQYEAPNPVNDLLGSPSERKEKPSPERDSMFTNLLWQAHIQKIVDPEGNEQTEFSYSAASTMKEQFPLNATLAINEAIEKIRAATAVFTFETDEDFLAKP